MQDIIIKKDKENYGYEVIQGDKRTGTLGFDETLGIIAALIMPEDRANLRWLKTEEQHRLFKESLNNIKQ